MDAFSITKAARLAQVSPYTLENWDRSGFLSPNKRDERGRRQYTFTDIVALRVATKLREQGVSLQGLRQVVKYLRERKGFSLSTTEALTSSVLLFDGRDVHVIEAGPDGKIAFSALREPGQTTFHVVLLGQLLSEIRTDARSLNAA